MSVILHGDGPHFHSAGTAEWGQVKVTHQALADELGSVRVFVSRMLRRFEERGWV